MHNPFDLEVSSAQHKEDITQSTAAATSHSKSPTISFAHHILKHPHRSMP